MKRREPAAALLKRSGSQFAVSEVQTRYVPQFPFRSTLVFKIPPNFGVVKGIQNVGFVVPEEHQAAVSLPNEPPVAVGNAGRNRAAFEIGEPRCSRNRGNFVPFHVLNAFLLMTLLACFVSPRICHVHSAHYVPREFHRYRFRWRR